MIELHLPWLELAILIPLVGSAVVSRIRDADLVRKMSVVTTSLAFVCTLGAWIDFLALGATTADDRFHLLSRVFGYEPFTIDQLSAPLLPMAALLYCLTMVATLRTKVRRFRFAWNLIAESVLLATFCSTESWTVIGLLSVGCIFPFLILRVRAKSTRIYLFHMSIYVGGMVLGQLLIDRNTVDGTAAAWAVAPLLTAILVRNGIAPFHCWVSDLFEKASFGGALLFVAPITGAYAAVRLFVPVAPQGMLQVTGMLSLGTAIYAAAISLIQQDCRRFFSCLFLSHASLVLFGLTVGNPIGVTGALCIWLSISLATGGLGLTLRAMESRCGRLSLVDFQGLYEHTPNLAMCFVLTGLASVGFPGTFGFVGTELLVDGGVEAYPYLGMAVVVVAALNGIAIVHAYFRLFTGVRYFSSVSLLIRVRERYAVLALAALILLGGLVPQRWVESRYHAAVALLNGHGRHSLATEPQDESPVLASLETSSDAITP